MATRDKTIRVLLCNQQTLFQDGIKALFLEMPSIEVVGSAATAKQALYMLRRLRPHVVLLDATTYDPSGSEVTRRIKAIDPHVGVLILSLYDDEVLISGCLDAGATGFIRKDAEPLQLSQAITTAYERSQRAA